MLRIISERTLETDEELSVCFIDWQKAFDRVTWTKLMQILEESGIDWHERRLISNLYMTQSVKVRLNRGETRSVKLKEDSILLPNLCTYLIKNYHNSHLKLHTFKMSVKHNQKLKPNMFRSQSCDHHQGSVTVLVQLLLIVVHASSYSGLWLYVVCASVRTIYLSVWCLVMYCTLYCCTWDAGFPSLHHPNRHRHHHDHHATLCVPITWLLFMVTLLTLELRCQLLHYIQRHPF